MRLPDPGPQSPVGSPKRAAEAALIQGRSAMLHTGAIGALAPILASLATALTITVAVADDAKYPDWKGQWNRQPPPRGLPGQVSFDPFKGWAKFQQAPLTP